MSNLGRPQSGANHRLGSLDGQYAQSSMRFPDASFNLDESARRPLDGAVSPRQSGWKSAGPEYLPIAGLLLDTVFIYFQQHFHPKSAISQ